MKNYLVTAAAVDAARFTCFARAADAAAAERRAQVNWIKERIEK